MKASLAASCRIAIATYLHDLGKLAERAGIFSTHPALDAHKQTYCPFNRELGYFSHVHAAYTALAFDDIESLLPDALGRDTYPFAGRVMADDKKHVSATDSLINAAAKHHKPETFLQWIVATADRVASGFEREEFENYNTAKDERKGLTHYTARQFTLFEQVRLNGSEANEDSLNYRYPLKPLAPANLFPTLAKECEGRDKDTARAEYEVMWSGFKAGLAQIPASHRQNLALWLDHFDSLWLTWTHTIPAATAFGVKPEVSLYDHSRTAAALATALWRWHEAKGQTDVAAAQAMKDHSDFAEQKFLLIQGDFFGIQDFVFANGGETNKQAAKLLRGRSFQVSLFTEIAALHLLDLLGLPPTSQIINAAGKFLIVAPNTPEVEAALRSAETTFNDWFIERTFGQAGVGLAWIKASCQDFLRKDKAKAETVGFSRLMRQLIDALDVAKHRRFDLCASGGRVFTESTYPHGPCKYNGRLPADGEAKSCALSRDQIKIGESLVKLDRLLVLRSDASDALRSGQNTQRLECTLFGYALAFTKDADITGKFGELAGNGSLRRCWDFSPPAEDDLKGEQPLWSGYARRFISGYVPRMSSQDEAVLGRYLQRGEDFPPVGDLKTFDMLACEDRAPSDDNAEKWLGVAALGVLKGDVDNLGDIFRIGTQNPSFAKYASLSRQMNSFFAIWLPWYLARKHPGIYTVFAGGDDFFLLGPWRSMQKLAADMQKEFARYAASNEFIHFSAGIATQKPGAPIHTLAELAQDALEQAKGHKGQDGQIAKNAITCFGETLPWSGWPAIESALARLNGIRRESRLSTGYVYGLLQFVEMRREEATKPEAAIWRSRFQYRTRRFVVDKMKGLDEDARRKKFTELVTDIAFKGIDELGANYRIVLFNHLYQFRDR